MVNARTGDTEKLGRLYTMRGKKADRGQGAGLRRHRRHRQDGEGQDRRYPVRRPEGRRPEGTALRRALLLRGHRPQDPGPGGQDRPGPGPSERGGSHLLRGQQRRDPPDGALRRRRHAGGCAGQQAEEPLQCGGGTEARAGALSGEDPQDCPEAGPPQEADRRQRPVRRRVDPL